MEARCNHVRGATARDTAVLKQLLIRRAPSARAARAQHRRSTARGPRASAGPAPMEGVQPTGA